MLRKGKKACLELLLAGDPDGPEGSVSGVEIELSEMDQLGKRHSGQPGLPAEAAEYAGSRSGQRPIS